MMEEERTKMTYDQAAEFIRQYIETAGKKQSQVAQELGISPGALSSFLSGTYKAPHTIIIRIEDLAAINTQKNVAPTAPAFKDTSISKTVSQAIRYSHLQGKISVVYGDAGVGKTVAYRNYLENNTLAIGITISPTYASITGVNELIAEQLGVRERVARKQTAEIINKLRGSGRVLIIDEAQHLNARALDHLRCISDESGIGICFIGNHQVYRKLLGSQEADFAQMFSRLGMRKQVLVGNISKNDVQTVFGEMVPEQDAIEILYRICRTNYGLRGAVNVFINTAAVFEQITASGLTKMMREMNIG
ncbi:MAG: AAA family ATPase [Lachnospiraceae bacterium]|nr:AAA family ATPase [Lachnospiraceae bacterium]MDE7339955.1 AAA family ATPase [Lachnospiraceae bacterium]